VAGRQLKIELSRPGGVRRARNSQQNLTSLHSENSSSHNDLLAASSLGSGPAAEPGPLHAHSLPNTLGAAGGILGAVAAGGSGSGGLQNGSGSGQMASSSSLQGSTELQAMFHNLMLHASQPGTALMNAMQSGGQSGIHGRASGQGGDSFQTPPDTPAAERSSQEPPGSVHHGGGGAAMVAGGDSGVLAGTASGTASVVHSPATAEDSFAAAQRAWANSVSVAGSSAPAHLSRSSVAAGAGGAAGGSSGMALSLEQGAPGGMPGNRMHGDAVHSMPLSGPHQNLPPSDSATSLHSGALHFYNTLLQQFAANPSTANTSPEAMEGSYQSMISELLQGPAGAQRRPPQLPSSMMPPAGPDAAARMYSQPHPPAAVPSSMGAPLMRTGSASGTDGQGHVPLPVSSAQGNGTLPATLAAAAASAAAALARDASIPPEEHEARLHQHLMEQLSNMHRHAIGQNMMDQCKSHTPPANSPHANAMHRSPPLPGGPSSLHHSHPPHPPSIGGPHRSLPHSPRGLPPGPRGPHPLSSMSHFTPSPPPAPPSIDSDLNSPGRGGSCGSSSLRPMSPGAGGHARPTGASTPRPISARHSRSPLAGGHSNASSLPVRCALCVDACGCTSPALPGRLPYARWAALAGRLQHARNTPAVACMQHASTDSQVVALTCSPSLQVSVAGSYNSVGEYLDPGGGGSRRASHSGEHFILAPEAVGTGPGQDSRTTLMIRNIPNKYTQKVLMQTIDNAGFYGKYDFFYLPIDFKNRCNVGYAFINMASTEVRPQWLQCFHTGTLHQGLHAPVPAAAPSWQACNSTASMEHSTGAGRERLSRGVPQQGLGALQQREAMLRGVRAYPVAPRADLALPEFIAHA
jgi:RNA recognition motif 2